MSSLKKLIEIFGAEPGLNFGDKDRDNPELLLIDKNLKTLLSKIIITEDTKPSLAIRGASICIFKLNKFSKALEKHCEENVEKTEKRFPIIVNIKKTLNFSK